MIKETEIIIDITPRNITFYKEKKYSCKIGESILVKIEELNSSCKKEVTAVCDCGAEIKMRYEKYLANKNRCGYYGCKKCSNKKRIIINQEKHGVDNTSQLDSVKEKREKTNLEKYGEKTNLLTKETKERIKKTNLERYGVEQPLKSKEIRDKGKETLIEKWGVDSYSKTQTFKKQMSYNHDVINKYKNLLSDEFKIINYQNYDFIIEHISKKHLFNINIKNLYIRINDDNCICTECYPISEHVSIKEKEIIDWLKELNIDFIEGDRKILEGKELDIYIPSKNLAIEFNGLYYHSELFKEKNYHLDKSLKCQEKGIQLLHIWEDEWIFKQDIVKSIILNKLGLIKEKIYAIECEVREVKDSKLVRNFLNENHIQGYSQSSIKLGLYHKEKLVSLMVFGERKIKKNIEFELIRFCNKINSNIIGASSKIFTYFKNNYDFKELISYSDFRLFGDKMYETLGFTKIHLSPPDYFWCKDLERRHRFNFNKQKLIKEGYDPNKTEVMIMHERGYYRIFSCGQVKWIIK